MRAFLAVTGVLIVLSVLPRSPVVGAVETGGGWLLGGLRRLLSPAVAGVPQLGKG